MKDLIEALQILYKYGNPDYPTHCEHDVMYFAIDPEIVSDDDQARLDDLGVSAAPEESNFYSFRFGN